MKLPNFSDALLAVDEGVATPLDHFVYENEPAGKPEKQWRERLETLLDWAVDNWRT